MKQFNGEYGCTFCLHSGESFDAVYKYPISENVYPMWNHNELIRTLKEAHTLNKNSGLLAEEDILEAKGPSVLSYLKYLDLDESMSPK